LDFLGSRKSKILILLFVSAILSAVFLNSFRSLSLSSRSNVNGQSENKVPDLENMSLQDRLDYYVERLPTILSASQEERREFMKWRKQDLAALSQDERSKQREREENARNIWEKKQGQAAWNERCGDRPVTIFDDDPAHPWNDIYRALYVRKDGDGCLMGFDTAEPYLYPKSSALISGEQGQLILNKLRNFAKHDVIELKQRSIERAIMQRSLLQVYHWAIEISTQGAALAKNAGDLAHALAVPIRALALTKVEIESLPNNLEMALEESQNLSEPQKTSIPPLPKFLSHSADGSSVVGMRDGPTARVHLAEFHNGSAFFVYWRLPSGLKETDAYIRTLAGYMPKEFRSGERVWRNPATPQFPVASQFAIVRRAVLLASDFSPVVSPIVESVQGRIYKSISKVSTIEDRQQVPLLYHFSAAKFLRGSSGLEEVSSFAMDHLRFMKYEDPFEVQLPSGKGPQQESVYDSCVRCHAQREFSGKGDAAGIFSVHSYTRMLAKPQVTGTPEVISFSEESKRIISYISRQPSWRQLKMEL
jgi:hypothetical protein